MDKLETVKKIVEVLREAVGDADQSDWEKERDVVDIFETVAKVLIPHHHVKLSLELIKGF